MDLSKGKELKEKCNIHPLGKKKKGENGSDKLVSC